MYKFVAATVAVSASARRSLNSFEQYVIPEWNLKVRNYTHPKIGTEISFFEKKQPTKKVFINFFTPLENDKGITHIIEHLIAVRLWQRYPDLFFASASNFGAGTGSLFTQYTFESTDESELIQFLEVFLDEVFDYKFNELEFKKEAWTFIQNPPKSNVE